MPTIIRRMQQRRAAAAKWAGQVLLPGEIGVDLDTGRLKVGRGGLAWEALSWIGDGLVTWANLGGKPAVIAAGDTQAEARAAIGAGTSNLAIGTTSTAAMRGDWRPAPADIVGSGATGRAVVASATAGDARAAIGAAASADIPVVPPTPTWSTLTGKPAAIGAGATQAEARAAIGAAASADIPTVPAAASAAPADLAAAAAVGTSESWARADHVHKRPTPAEIGAAAAGAVPLPSADAPLALGTANAGAAATWSRSDHRHPMPAAIDVGALPATAPTADTPAAQPGATPPVAASPMAVFGPTATGMQVRVRGTFYAIGRSAGQWLTTAFNGVAIGPLAASALDVCNHVVAVGASALEKMSGSGSSGVTAVGAYAGMTAVTQANTTLVGTSAGRFATALTSVTALGNAALMSMAAAATGITAIGARAADHVNCVGNNGTFVGHNAGMNVTQTTAPGTVALGCDSQNNGAHTDTADQVAIGTVRQRVRIRGGLELTGSDGKVYRVDIVNGVMSLTVVPAAIVLQAPLPGA